MNQKIICIVANQRAGTTALQRAIELTGTTANFSEIFQGEPEQKRTNRQFFADFARENDIKLADTLFAKGASAVVEQYLDYLKKQAKSKHVLIDIKFNAWFAITPTWRYTHEQPFLMEKLKRARAVFIFIWRESLADQILSEAIADALGVWHNLDAKRAGGRKIEVSIAKIKRQALLICRSEADMLKHLSDYADKIVVKYEDLFVDGVPSPSFSAEFKKLTGIEFAHGQKGGMRPNAVPKNEIITNYDKAVAVIDKIAAKRRSPLLTGAPKRRR